MGDNARQGNLGFFRGTRRARAAKAAMFDLTAQIVDVPPSTVTAPPPTLPVSMSPACMNG